MLSAKQIPPGKSGEIEVKVNTAGLTALSKSVRIRTNDPRQADVVLFVRATVVPEFSLSERSIFFGNVTKGTEAIREILLKVQSGKDSRVLGVESTNGNFSARLEPVPGADGKTVKVVAVQRADAREGYHIGNIVIRTNSTLTPELRISVRGIVGSP